MSNENPSDRKQSPDAGNPIDDASQGAVGADGTPGDRSRKKQQEEEASPGRGINQAGYIKDSDAKTGDGETPGSSAR